MQSYRGRSGTAGLAAPGCPVVNVGEMCGPFDVEVPGALAGIGTSMAGGAEAGVTFQSREAPTVAFMFDDGTGIVQNGRYAMQDVLDQYGVKGSFFLTGRAMQTYPSAVRALVAGGHRVGNHTWSHPYLTRLGDAAIGAELDQAEAQFRAIVPGATTRPCFRAPNGDLNARVLAVADGRGYREIAQDVSSNDWAGVSAARMIDSVLREVRDGARVSFHSQEPQTLIALRTLVPTLLAEGYQFVTAC